MDFLAPEATYMDLTLYNIQLLLIVIYRQSHTCTHFSYW